LIHFYKRGFRIKMVSENGFVLVGAGLPRTGTMSTRAALQQILQGNVYHMATVMNERPDHHPHWRKVCEGAASDAEWRTLLADYRGGVDYPISFFYKEIFKAFPNAKVLLNVRDPVRWYESVKNAIHRLHLTFSAWPCTWFLAATGQLDAMNLVFKLSDLVPGCSSGGTGMFSSVAAGQQAAVQFFHDHVEEVKATIPADQLLVWEVKEGWAPLCKFLDVPVPDTPFPRVNDTAQIEGIRVSVQRAAWLFVVIFPAIIFFASLFNGVDLVSTGGLLVGYALIFYNVMARLVPVGPKHLEKKDN